MSFTVRCGLTKAFSNLAKSQFIIKRDVLRTCCNSTSPSLMVGKPAPEFRCSALLPSGKEGEVCLSDYKGRYVVLFFYPLDFTFVCPTEIISFSDRAKEFEEINCSVVAASCDSYFSHLAWSQQPRNNGGIGNLNIPILADLTHKISKDYNVLMEDKGFPLRGLFVIDGNGILKHITVNDTGVGRSVDEVKRLVQAFQFVEKHGEVCPANWKSGEKTINVNKPDEFFNSEF